jgi:hypothetical protein
MIRAEAFDSMGRAVMNEFAPLVRTGVGRRQESHVEGCGGKLKMQNLQQGANWKHESCLRKRLRKAWRADC